MIFKIDNTLDDNTIHSYKVVVKFLLLSFGLIQIVLNNFSLDVFFTVFIISRLI